MKKEIKESLKKKQYIKNILINWRKECYGEMVLIDSYLVLTNDSFNEMFEKLMNKLKKVK